MRSPPKTAYQPIEELLPNLEQAYPGTGERFESLMAAFPDFPSTRILLALAARPDLVDANEGPFLDIYTPTSKLAELKRYYPRCVSESFLKFAAAFESIRAMAEYIAADPSVSVGVPYIRTTIMEVLDYSIAGAYTWDGQPKSALKILASYFQCDPRELMPEPEWVRQELRWRELWSEYPKSPTPTLLRLVARYKSVDDCVADLKNRPLLIDHASDSAALRTELLAILRGEATGYDANFKPTPLGQTIIDISKELNYYYYHDPLPNPYWNTKAGREEIIRTSYRRLPTDVIDKIVEHDGLENFIRAVLATSHHESVNPPVGLYQGQLQTINITGQAYTAANRPYAVINAIATYLDTEVEGLFPRGQYGKRPPRGPREEKDLGASEGPYSYMPLDLIDFIDASNENFSRLVEMLPKDAHVSPEELKQFALTGSDALDKNGNYSRVAQAAYLLVNIYRDQHGRHAMPIERLFPKAPTSLSGSFAFMPTEG